MLKDEYEGTQFRYDKEMNLQKVTDKIQHPDVIERLVYQDNIALSDMYLLRAVMFFRVCTARMVAEWIVYFRTKYGEEECKRLAMPTPDYNILAQKDGIIPDKFVVDVEDRLKKLARKNVLLHEKYMNSSKRERYELNFFLANSYTFRLTMIRFDEDADIHYIGNYSLLPAHRMLGYMHAGSVTIRAFMHCRDAEISRERGVIYGSQKELYVPDMMVERVIDQRTWCTMIEAIHLSHDEKEITKKELGDRVREKIRKMKDLLRHDTYMYKKYGEAANKRFRIIICTDDLNALAVVLKVAAMEQCAEIFSERVFAVSDAALQRKGYRLRDAGLVLTAFDAGDGTKNLNVEKLTEKVVEMNPWIP